MFRSATQSDQASKKIGSATMVARSKWCKIFQKWLLLTTVSGRAPSSAAYSIHFTSSSLKALPCEESSILSALEKKYRRKHHLQKTAASSGTKAWLVLAEKVTNPAGSSFAWALVIINKCAVFGTSIDCFSGECEPLPHFARSVSVASVSGPSQFRPRGHGRGSKS